MAGKLLHNSAWFGPINPSEADYIIDDMLNDKKLLQALKDFLTHEQPPSGFCYAIQVIAENKYNRRYNPDSSEREAVEVDEHEGGVPA